MVTAVVYFTATDPVRFGQVLSTNSSSLIAAPGYLGHTLKRGIEDPTRFLLTVDWESVQDHTNWQTENAESFLAALSGVTESGPDIAHFH